MSFYWITVNSLNEETLQTGHKEIPQFQTGSLKTQEDFQLLSMKASLPPTATCVHNNQSTHTNYIKDIDDLLSYL